MTDATADPTQEPRARFERLVQAAQAAGATSLQLVADTPSRLRTPREGFVPLDEPPLGEDELHAVARALFGAGRLERLPREGVVSTSLRVAGRLARATFATNLGRPSLGVRFRDASPVVPLEALGGPPALERVLEADHGLVLVAGPTGSGKTTTLYALVDRLCRDRALHVCTVEDEVARDLVPGRSLVQQREVGTDVPDAARGIAAAMAQDIDALAITAVTDVEALGAALHAAETGHLVLLQLHAADARDALLRVVEASPPSMQPLVRRLLAELLRGVVAQVLVPRATKGRAQVHEVLLPDDALRAALREGRPLAGLAGAPGSVTLAEEAARHAAAGTITPEAARRLRGEEG